MPCCGVLRDISMQEHDKSISTQGSCCPMPLVLVTKAVNEMQKGEVLKITGDDPLFEAGLKDFCEARNLKFLETQQDQTSTTVWIKL
jgi:TusA-related sulfurtransferase